MSVKRWPLLLCAALVLSAEAQPLDPMVPINPDMADAKTLAADLRMAHERWGLRRFILTGPHAVNTQFNKTTVDTYRKLGERIAEVRGHLHFLAVKQGKGEGIDDRRCQHIQRSTADGLICFQFYRRYGQQNGKNTAADA